MTDSAWEGLEGQIRRGFYVGLAVLITALAVAGFWPTYWGPLFSGTLDLHWLLHVHGVVFTLWLVVLTAQAGLVYQGQTELHQTVGTSVGVAWGVLLILAGLSAIVGNISPAVGTEYETLQGFIAELPVLSGGLVSFSILFVAGIALQRRPAAHKRLMVLASAGLLSAPVGRLHGLFEFGAFAPFVTYLPVLPGLLLLAYDWTTRSRFHPATLFGTVLIAVMESRFRFIFTDTWHQMAGEMADSVRSVLLPLM